VFIPTGSTSRLWASVHNLKGGVEYQWQVRVLNSAGDTSSWVPFTAGGAVAIQTDFTPPSTPVIVSTSGRKSNGWASATSETFTWSAKDGGSGVAGYSYSFGHTLHAPRPVMGSATSGSIHNLADGKWVLHVWARDKAGNWSKLGYFVFNIDHTAPKVLFKAVTTNVFDAYVGQESWTFDLAKKAAVSVSIDRSGKWTVETVSLGTLKAGGHTFTWNGKGPKGDLAPAGWYWISIQTKDFLGNTGSFPSAGIRVSPVKPVYPYVPEVGRHIVVSLSKEAIYAYDGSTLVKWSLATTGNPALPTPTGHFSIFARFSPFEFISPWPEGSPYYYSPSWVTYAMEFQDEGYFIHDAPWRTVFGPGSDGPGTPGTNYGGSHGCVNVPFAMAQFLWSWSTIGTVVDIIN